jgi:hypothetical protein
VELLEAFFRTEAWIIIDVAELWQFRVAMRAFWVGVFPYGLAAKAVFEFEVVVVWEFVAGLAYVYDTFHSLLPPQIPRKRLNKVTPAAKDIPPIKANISHE